MRSALLAPSLFAAALLVGCGAYRPARFADRDPITVVPDAPIPRPARTVIPEWSRYAEAYVKRWLVDGLDPRRTPEAGDIDAFDRVVESAWFAPARPPSLEGYTRAAPAPPFAPVTDDRVLEKLALEVVDDADGRRWELSPEAPERARLRSSAGAISSRLLFALGYHAAESHVLVREDGTRVLAIAWSTPRAEARAGERCDWLGSTRPTGTREDDDNDVVPHEDRRSLRVLGLVSSWVGLREIRPRVLRDVYVGEDGAGHVEHQVAGLEDSLGAGALLAALRRDDERPARNPWVALGSLGFSAKESADPDAAPFPTVGLFPEHADPRRDRLAVPFGPAQDALPSDLYWMGKRIAVVSDDTLASAVQAGQLDTDASAYLVRALAERREDVARFAVSLVTPLEIRADAALMLDPAGSRFLSIGLRDEAITRGYASSESTRYLVELMGEDGTLAAPGFELTPRGSSADLALPFDLFDGRDYLVVRLRSVRDGMPAPRWMEVHLRRHDGPERETDVRIRGVRH